MAIRKKGSRKIVVDDQEFRWRASGQDHGISVVIWPVINENAIIETHLNYHISKCGKTLAVTNRMVRATILHLGVQKILLLKERIRLPSIEGFYSITKGVWQDPSQTPCLKCSEQFGYETMCQAG